MRERTRFLANTASSSRTVATRRSEWLPVAALACVLAAAYALTSLFRHWRFDSGYDLSIFDQAIWHLSRFELPGSSIRGYDNLLGDHFHPILATLAPLYWIAPSVETLLIVQALLLALSVVPVYLFLRDRLSHSQALTLCVAYGCFWGLQRTALFDFHELAFAPVLVATAVLAISRRQWRLLWLACAILVLVKEDLIPLVCGFGLYLVYLGEYRKGAILAASSFVLFVTVLFVVIPWFGGGAWAYGGAYGGLAARPWTIPLMLVTPIEKLRTVFFWLAPFAFLSVFSPLGLLLVPVALERLLSSQPTHWGHGAHYSAPLAPLLVMAAGDTLGRLAARVPASRRRTMVVRVLIGVCLVSSLLLPGHQPFLRLFTARHYAPPTAHGAARQALSRIGPDASVVAQVSLLPHLSHRQALYMLEAGAPDADFVVSAAHLDTWPQSRDEMMALIEERRRRGYAVVFEQDGWLVLARP